ncbi:MAG TPA: MarR family winged helix-turn-helix transcriptional regulator, partial [Streptosporangiaceae bacterium]
AGYLLLRHHSAVELVDRAEAAGFVRRVPDNADGRLVRVALTAKGDRCLNELTPAHLAELHDLAALLDELVAGWDGRSPRPVAAEPGSSGPMPTTE